MRTAEMAALRFSDLQEDDPTDRGPSRPRLSTWQTALLVAAGGGVGAALRLIVTLSMPAVTTPTLVEVPWATLWGNLIGCMGLGALVGALTQAADQSDPQRRPGHLRPEEHTSELHSRGHLEYRLLLEKKKI